VQAACKNITFEIIVVDNNSTDGSCEMLHGKFPSIKLLSNNKNIGFSKANNQGVAFAEGEYVLILNPDTVIAEDTLEQVLHFAEEKGNLGAIGVKFIDGAGNFLPECKRNVPNLAIASRKLIGDSKRYYANQIAEDEDSKVEILTGAFMFLKRDVYVKVGGFDEDYFMFGEDIDLSYKLLNQGFQNYYFGKTCIIHYKGESTIKDNTYLKNFYGAMQIFYKKHFNYNVVSAWLLKTGLKVMILMKSTDDSVESYTVSKLNRVLLISENLSLFKRLTLKMDPVKVTMGREFPNDVSLYDKIIFDNSLLSFKEIINYFQNIKSKPVSLRIIPKNTSFYIGSDSSNDRGEIIKF